LCSFCLRVTDRISLFATKHKRFSLTTLQQLFFRKLSIYFIRSVVCIKTLCDNLFIARLLYCTSIQRSWRVGWFQPALIDQRVSQQAENRSLPSMTKMIQNSNSFGWFARYNLVKPRFSAFALLASPSVDDFQRDSSSWNFQIDCPQGKSQSRIRSRFLWGETVVLVLGLLDLLDHGNRDGAIEMDWSSLVNRRISRRSWLIARNFLSRSECAERSTPNQLQNRKSVSRSAVAALANSAHRWDPTRLLINCY